MSDLVVQPPATDADDATATPKRTRLARLRASSFLAEESHRLALLGIVALPLTAAAWLLLTPPTVFSREMTWDLLFNLEGAWHLWDGQELHVDVHDPLGVVTFGLTVIGFHLVGVGPRAFLVGETIYAGLMLAAAICVLPRRLPLAAAVIATVYVVLLVLMPTNLGDPVDAYSFAMSYNRLGWSALTLLFLVLFLSPRSDDQAWLDQAITFLLAMLLFYLKITYFGAAMGAIAASMLLCGHIRRRAVAWSAVLAAVAIVAAAPFNVPYWRDILAAVDTGAVRWDTLSEVKYVLNAKETAVLATELAGLLWLKRAGVSLDRFASAVFIVGCGLFILSQNQQSGVVAVNLVVALLLFDSARAAVIQTLRWHGPEATLLPAAILIPPSIAIISMGASLLGYYIKASATEGTEVLETTNLGGLAVAAKPADLIALFSGQPLAPGLLNKARLEHPRYELSQTEYMETIRDAADSLRWLLTSNTSIAEPQVRVFDSVNPLPFMLSLSPPRGGALWFDTAFPWPPAEQALGFVDYVFVPKFPTESAVTRTALRHYGDYLARNFRRRIDTRSWIVFARAGRKSAELMPTGTASGQ
jgi:hypothetical protein